jgi:hypothetical protein
MDMESSFRLMFFGLLGVGVIGMFVCRRWPSMAVLILPLLAWGGVSQIVRLNHVYANEAINAKPGMNLRYIVIFYLVIATSALLVLIGALQGRRRRKLGAYSH